MRGIRTAAEGGSPLDPRAARSLLEAKSAPDPLAGISPREREVLGLLLDGMPNKLIARRLEISEKTVKSHLTSIFRQIGVTDRVQAILWVERQGLRERPAAVDQCDQCPVAAGGRPPQTACVIRFLVSALVARAAVAARSPSPRRSPPLAKDGRGEVRVAGRLRQGRDVEAEAEGATTAASSCGSRSTTPVGRRLARRRSCTSGGSPGRAPPGRRASSGSFEVRRTLPDLPGRRRDHRARLGAARGRVPGDRDAARVERRLNRREAARTR